MHALELLGPIMYGWLIGIGISILLFGPAFFLLVNVSIKDGFSRGALLSLGVFLSDLVIVLLIHFGLSDFYSVPLFQIIFSFIAGVAMIAWGIKTMRGKYRNFLADIHKSSSKGGSLIKGFATNILNPFAFVLWTTTIANVSAQFESTEQDYEMKVIVAVISILFGLLSMDLIKAFSFHLVGKKIKYRFFFRVQLVIGLLLFGAGVYFLFQGFRVMIG